MYFDRAREDRERNPAYFDPRARENREREQVRQREMEHELALREREREREIRERDRRERETATAVPNPSQRRNTREFRPPSGFGPGPGAPGSYGRDVYSRDAPSNAGPPRPDRPPHRSERDVERERERDRDRERDRERERRLRLAPSAGGPSMFAPGGNPDVEMEPPYPQPQPPHLTLHPSLPHHNQQQQHHHPHHGSSREVDPRESLMLRERERERERYERRERERERDREAPPPPPGYPYPPHGATAPNGAPYPPPPPPPPHGHPPGVFPGPSSGPGPVPGPHPSFDGRPGPPPVVEREFVLEPEKEPKAKKTIHLGTFVYPDSPFPYFFFAPVGASATGKENHNLVPADGKENEKEKPRKEEKPEKEKEILILHPNLNKEPSTETKPSTADGPKPLVTSSAPNTKTEGADKKVKVPDVDDPDLLDTDTQCSIVIPSGHLLTSKPDRPRIWGGGLFTPVHELYRQERGEPSRPPTARPRRRVYTDDSEPFLCALHAGFITWSGAKKAQAKGWDLKLDIRVIRCMKPDNDNADSVLASMASNSPSTSSGAQHPGILNTFNAPPGSRPPGGGPGAKARPHEFPTSGRRESEGRSSTSENVIKAEAVARFLGGPGERYWGDQEALLAPLPPPPPLPSKPSTPVTADGQKNQPEREEGEVEDEVLETALVPAPAPPPPVVPNEPEPVSVAQDDPSDDGRSIPSCGWGIGHDGSAIEIVGASFVEVRLFKSLFSQSLTSTPAARNWSCQFAITFAASIRVC